VTSPAFLIGLLIINTIFLIREFVKGVLVSKRLEDAEELVNVKILEVLNLEDYMGKQIQKLRQENKELKEIHKELTAVPE
jgi:CRISPR/Cas system-associated endonuclease Cas1